MEREQLLFQNSIKSPETLKQYQYSLVKFRHYVNVDTYHKLANLPKKELQNSIEDYVMERKAQGKSRSVIRMTLCSLELFCDVNDVEIKWKKIRRLLPAQKKRQGAKAYTTQQVQMMLQHTIGVRNTALIHFLASSGVRIGAIPELKIKHMTEYKDGCKILVIYPGEYEEYHTFLTPEASTAMNRYLEKRQNDGEVITPENPLFRDHYSLGSSPPKHLKKISFQYIVDRIARRSGIRHGHNGERRDTQLNHGFRKRWNTIVKTTDGVKIILAEKMFGHTTPTIPLDETYLDASDEILFTEFSKAIQNLTVDSSERLRVKNQQLQNEKSQLEKAIEIKDEMAIQLQHEKFPHEGMSDTWKTEMRKMILELNSNAT